MIVKNFIENCTQYTGFEIWDVENMDAFLSGNDTLAEIFQNDYEFPVEEFNERRSEITENNMEIMESLLEQIGDKHFYIFTLHSENHLELIQMQEQNIMNFGIDIEGIKNDHVFIVIMDKKAENSTMQI